VADEIKKGDVVTLKSGGPKMTVAWVEQDEALCEWFDSKSDSQQKRFALAVLAKA
jgi:uncharacterized protein YodC (DUF2158 family)